MSATMAEVIAAHKELAWESETGLSFCECGVKLCTMPTPINTQRRKLYAHVAEELAKAGYGDVREAKREAWDDAYVLGVEDHKTSLNYTSDDFGIPGGFPWYPARANPYQEPPHGVD